jgi:hypothetical protein
MIENYLELLARELDFDRSLSRCVRQEVEDHLWEAVAADRSGNSCEAERQAVANFGDARAVAAEFAVISLARHSRRAGIAALLVIVSVFVATKARVAWYAAMQLTISDDLRAAGGLVMTIDRCALLSSVVIGLGGWIYIWSRQIPAAFDPAYLRQLRRFFPLCGAAAAALVVSVISDAVLTGLQLTGTGPAAEFLVPILSIAIELVCVSILIFPIRGVALRAACTAALTQT